VQNTYWLVRAGESVSEADGRVDTNRATKQGTGAGLSELGKRQVAEGALPMAAREACGGGCFVYYGTVRRSEQIAAAIGAAAGLSQSRLIPEFSFLDPRGLGALEGGQLAAVADEVSAGDASSPLYRPPMGTTGTPNESLGDVLMRVTQLVSAEVSERMRARERERERLFLLCPLVPLLFFLLLAASASLDLRHQRVENKKILKNSKTSQLSSLQPKP
jgi:broad specificity phosphatase PhoE